MYQAIFYLFAGLTLGSALVVVASRNILRSAFALLFTFFGVAGLYVMLSADFLAATQVIIYVGGILILILFAVMLTQKIGLVSVTNQSQSVVVGLLSCSFLAALLLTVIFRTPWAEKIAAPAQPTTARIGNLLLTDYLLPFEIVSVLLVAALVGAVILAKREEE
jgi:NADH-quinone oxidoreductase subunit J